MTDIDPTTNDSTAAELPLTDEQRALLDGPAEPAIPVDVDLMDPTFPIAAARAAMGKGGEDILVLRVGDVVAHTDFFVIVTASNPRLVRTIVQEIEFQVHQAGGPKPLRLEGMNEAEWVLADYGTFAVHVFHTETRRYYELERLWGDVPKIDWVDPDAPGPVAAY